MPVIKKRMSNGEVSISVTDESGTPVAVVSSFLAYLSARECSPNTSIAYAHDLSHWWKFLAAQRLSWYEIRPVHTVEFLQFLRRVTTTHRSRRTGPRLALVDNGELCAALAPSTINRILAAISSFYQFAILTDQYRWLNPIEKSADFATERVSDRHLPAMGRASWQRPMRRRLAVRSVIRVPRPLSTQQVKLLLTALRSQRDLALVRLMLDGGLRPGEVLALKLEDISYGHRRIVVRCRNDHPKGVRAKSRFERVVDLYEPATLSVLNEYVIAHRPADGGSPFVFLVGGRGRHRAEPLGYAALAKLFSRACCRAGIHEPWVSPHALRHTHASRMWDAGMRELTLQKRLGHASPESTRMYTKVSDRAVVADYRRALGLDAMDVENKFHKDPVRHAN
jgi:integrase